MLPLPLHVPAEGDFGKQTVATLLAGVTAAANFEAANAANKLQVSSTASVRGGTDSDGGASGVFCRP